MLKLTKLTFIMEACFRPNPNNSLNNGSMKKKSGNNIYGFMNFKSCKNKIFKVLGFEFNGENLREV